jgi:hypothetical protein
MGSARYVSWERQKGYRWKRTDLHHVQVKTVRVRGSKRGLGVVHDVGMKGKEINVRKEWGTSQKENTVRNRARSESGMDRAIRKRVLDTHKERRGKVRVFERKMKE